jgi:hypothetical protein
MGPRGLEWAVGEILWNEWVGTDRRVVNEKRGLGGARWSAGEGLRGEGMWPLLRNGCLYNQFSRSGLPCRQECRVSPARARV